MGYDPRFDEAEAELDSWRAWKIKSDSSLPNPLTIIADKWDEYQGSDYPEPLEFLHGTDRHGNKWSVAVSTIILKKRLIEGLVEDWSEKDNAFVVTSVEGRVEPGEVVSIAYEGEAEAKKGSLSKFKVVRKKLTEEQRATLDSKKEDPVAVAADSEPASDNPDDLPF